MTDSDVEDSFTFGSFSLEDTKEFKKSYSSGLHPMSWARIAAGPPKPPARSPAPAPAATTTAASAAAGGWGGGGGGSSNARDETGVESSSGAREGVTPPQANGVKGKGDQEFESKATAAGFASVMKGLGMASPSREGGGEGGSSGGDSGAAEKKGEKGEKGGVKEALSGEGAERAGGVGDAVDSAAVEAARAAAKAESEAKAAKEAAVESERAWKALLGTLGREDGLVVGAAVGGGVGGVGAGAPAAPTLQPGQPAPELIHRGLVNTGNSCFRSVVLQALLACEPFVGVLFGAAPGLRESGPAQKALPTWAQLAKFAAAFEPPKPGAAVPLGGRGSGKGRGSGGGGGAWSAPVGRNRGGRYHRASGAPEPVLPDEAMSKAFGAFRSANLGEQEDAQEFLAFFLDQVWEQKKAQEKEDGDQQGGLYGGGGGGGGGGGYAEDKKEDEWLEVGKGGAKAVVNVPDPAQRITGLFYGMFRSEVKKSGNAKSSVTREPFHCLQLDLDPPIPPAQSNNNHNNNAYGEGTSSSTSAWGATNGFETVNGSGGGGGGGPGVAGGPRGGSNGRGTAAGWSQRGGGGPAADGGGGGAWAGAGSMVSSGPGATILDEALAALFGGESVAGVKGRLNMEVKASRTLTLEQAPKILTLHLKQFSFHPELGPRKLARHVRYPLELTVPTRIMSPSLQHEASKKGPLKYRLFTVVLHHGRSLHGGHYTALVRDARGAWRHFDDQVVSPETEAHALNPVNEEEGGVRTGGGGWGSSAAGGELDRLLRGGGGGGGGEGGDLGGASLWAAEVGGEFVE
eukprot:jgi/Undpi1/7151/HiC_scaffold_22.g09625.m1